MDGHGESLATGARQSVLVVDAGDFARHRLKSALRAPDREVWTAATAREGLQMLFSIDENTYRGRTTLQLKLSDVRVQGQGALHLPSDAPAAHAASSSG